MDKVAVVTGGSSGIGRCAALALRDAGCAVYELSRRESEQQGIAHITCDVTDEAAVKAAIDSVFASEGRLDILICCAGFGISGAAEFTPADSARRQMDVNLIGTANAARAAIPHMRAGGGGRMVFTSSVAAVIPIPFQAWYSASKAAINAYAQALVNELRPFGITVCAMQPGDTKTGFTDSRKKQTEGDEIYGGAIERSVERMEKDERGGVPAERIGAYAAMLALKKRVRPLNTPGATYKLFVALYALMPQRMRSWAVGKLYAS